LIIALERLKAICEAPKAIALHKHSVSIAWGGML
jgi:hypothetical protein